MIAESVLSPENTFDRETPPSTSSPCPSDWRASISAASRGRFEVKTLPASLSYHRNAGMLWLLPWRIPAWLAPVCDERSHSQPVMRCVPERTHLARVGAWPSASAWRSTGSARPSIWMNRIPGTSVGVGGSRRLTMRRTVWRCQTASSSIDSQLLRMMPTTVMTNAARIASHSVSIVRPSRMSAVNSRSRPLAARPRRPAVQRMRREKYREMIGQITALRTEITAAARIAVPKSAIVMPGRIHATNQKLTAVIANSIAWRRSGTPRNVRGSFADWTRVGSPPRQAIPNPFA